MAADDAVDGNGVFDVEVRGDDHPEEDPTTLVEENGPEEEAEDEEEEVEVVVLPKKKRQKRTQEPTVVANVSRSGRAVHPSTLHGTIQPNRYSTIQ